MSMMLRRGMMLRAADAADYIRDGLVLWLDGIDKGSDPAIWPDKLGEYDFDLTDCTFTADGVVFDGNGRGSRTGNIPATIAAGTVEFCVEMDATNGTNVWGGIIIPGTADSRGHIGADLRYDYNVTEESPAFSIANDFRTKTSKYRFFPGVRILTASATEETCYANGAAVESAYSSSYGSFAPNSTSGLVTIGYRNNSGVSHVFKGTIHAIRMYNRQLTAAEMLNNQRLDNARFNLGLNI